MSPVSRAASTPSADRRIVKRSSILVYCEKMTALLVGLFNNILATSAATASSFVLVGSCRVAHAQLLAPPGMHPHAYVARSSLAGGRACPRARAHTRARGAEAQPANMWEHDLVRANFAEEGTRGASCPPRAKAGGGGPHVDAERIATGGALCDGGLSPRCPLLLPRAIRCAKQGRCRHAQWPFRRRVGCL